MDNENKVAIVVGGSSGIGYHTALKLFESGYIVYNFSRTKADFDGIASMTVDVEQSETIERAVNDVAQKEGRIDVLVYSAGYSMAAPVQHAKQKDVRRLFEINYFGALETVQCVLPVMRDSGGGRIILISSMGGVMPIAFDSFYSSSKAALDMLAKGLNIEAEPFGIRATSVQPGGVATRFTFKRNVYSENDVGDYADALRKATIKLEQTEQGGMKPEDAAEDIMKIINAKNPPATKAIGIKNKSFKLAKKLLPERLADSINRNMYLS